MDSIGNFLTIIRNGIMVGKAFVLAPHSKINRAIADILQKEGFIRGFEELEEEGKKQLKIMLKYMNNESVIHDIRRVSRLSCRTYARSTNIKPVISGLGLSILTTNRGIISHKDAKRLGVGGEVICTVW